MNDKTKCWGDETVLISGYVQRDTPLINDFRGKRAELNIYDDAMGIDIQMEYIVNQSHKDEDGITVIDDFRLTGMSVEVKNNEGKRISR